MEELSFLTIYYIISLFNQIEANVLVDVSNPEIIEDVIQNYIPTLRSNSEICRNQSILYAENLRKYTRWAAEMFDSTTKFPNGILEGSNYDFGNFDECIRTEVSYENYNFTGKYCLAKYTIEPSKYFLEEYMSNGTSSLSDFTNSSIWMKIINSIEDPIKNPRNILRFAFCMPSSCTNSDLQETLQEVIENLNEQVGFRVTVEIDQLSCQVQAQSSRLDYGDLIFIIISIIALCFVITGSCYYHFSNRRQSADSSGIIQDILLCFAVQKNIKSLTSVGNDLDGLNCTAGMKVYSMILIIVLHRNMFDFGSALSNSTYVEKIYTNFAITFILNGPILVDTFFTVSGFLATYLVLHHYQTAKRICIPQIYIHRYLRMVSVYVVILTFYCTIFVKFGDGPLWRERIEIEQQKCRNVWWANLLFINNYIGTSNYCMFQTWYMACDMQAFLLIPLLSLLYYKKPIIGIAVTILFIVVSGILVFTTIYIYDEMPILIPYMSMLLHPAENSTFLRVYIPGHLRASSYYIGALTGYIKYRLKNSHFKIPILWVRAGWILCASMMFISLHTAFVFFIHEVPVWISALYGALYHASWSLGIAWIVIAASSGYGNLVYMILSKSPLVILSRLTYTVYLCHGIIQMYSSGTIRAPVYASTYNTIHKAAGDIVLAYLLALILSLLFEAPMIALEKLIWRGGVVTHPKKEEHEGTRL
ncbi:nose resistant to fluoxetine protein 6-like [Diorhabda sublineata]|uniref:nose resistant to fluoxetine protein 6-like n=1 Tax=Diorhabda sublineata TaxID=1163346 RepID=UPI0024E188B1|nr:nose resistant to fluoxetine protein 6-like [Diorhabda sublineata]